MWQDVLMMIAVCLGGYSIYNFIFVLVKKIISRTKVSQVVYIFKSRRRYYPLLGIVILVVNMIGITQKSQEEIIIGKYMLSMRLHQFYNESGVLNKWVIYVFSIFLIANFILSIYIKPIMYEEGIVCENGNFLSWDKIKSINTLQNTLGNNKYIVINTINDKEVFLNVTNKESNFVKEIIFNKTGIVNKDIVTEFN
ncbi:Uncharacterised protein [uncultured Clostridium sp.]|uniref:hypothetical protein n=1 Tax=uncultured Clostridium sp. TaxID=59620 RepID=UPI0008222171|nr:hypothetical protein [uncultured Clostridium sp.]SCJ96882.1 Uncharacterised protein [uncultured Clostridium sp.]